MPNHRFSEDVPSAQRELLNAIKQHPISQLVRHSWLPPQDASQKWHIEPASVFRLTAGPLLITLESSLVIGCASLPEKASVTLWLEQTEDGQRDAASSLIDDADQHQIAACDPIYSERMICDLLGKQVTSIGILKKRPANALLAQLPCEVGVLLRFDHGSLVLAHGIHDNSDDFAILFERDISSDVLKELDEIQV
jgi:hypothetical protein